jgi:hypothetical protein
MAVNIRELLLASRSIELVGEKAGEDEKSFFVRVEGSIFEIAKEAIVSETPGSAASGVNVSRFVLRPDAKIVQSLLVDLQRGERPVAGSLFRQGRSRVRGVAPLGEFDCSRCTDCGDCVDCSRCTDCGDCVDCSRCTDCGDCGDCMVAGLPELADQRGLRSFRRRRR